MVRAVRILSVALVTAGLLILSDAAMTIAWKEPLSAIYGSLKQGEAAAELETVRDSFLRSPRVDRVESAADPTRRARRLANLFASTLEDEQSIGKIAIPSINIDYVVIEGTGTAALQRGPGHYPDTSLPGQGKTIGIAGHRTTYLAPFRNIDDIAEGDEIVLRMPYGTFTYEVTETRVVEPTQIEIVDNVGRERLVLTACHPPYSAAQRYAVFAKLGDFELENVP